MFDKEYVLKCLYPIFIRDINNEEERVKFWLEEMNNTFCKDLESIIEAVRGMERCKKTYIDAFNKWKEKKLLNSNNWKDEK